MTEEPPDAAEERWARAEQRWAEGLNYRDRPMYYDRQGRPMTLKQWAETFEGGHERREKLKRVAETTVEPCWISTVWLGMDHSFGYNSTPIIFETMIFVHGDPAQRVRGDPGPDVHPGLRELDNECWRYSTEVEALAGHDQVVAFVRARLSDVEAADAILAEAVERVEEKPDA